MKKRILSALLCVAMLLSMILGILPGTIRAEAVAPGTENKPVQEQPVQQPENGKYCTAVLEPFQLGKENATYQAIAPALRDLSASDEAAIAEAAAVLREAMVQRSNEIHVELTVSGLDAETTAFAVYYAAQEHTGNPKEGDYIKWNGPYGELSYSQTPVSGGKLTKVTYYLNYFTTAEQEAEVDAAVEELLEELDLWGATDYEKVCSVYTYLCHNITYDYEDIFEVSRHATYTAIIYHHTVCQGYATLFYRLLLELGVDNRVITSIDHAWNIVLLDGAYYNLDATWDAILPEYSYFLCGSANFPDHPPEDEYLTEEFAAQYPVSVKNYGFSGPSYVVDFVPNVQDLILENGTYYTADGYQVVIALDVPITWLAGWGTLKDCVEYYGTSAFSLTYWDQLLAAMNEDGFVVLTEETKNWFLDLITGNDGWGEIEEHLRYYLGYMVPGSEDYDENHVHQYAAVDRAPTCFMDGYTYYFCDCGDMFAEWFADVLSHDYQEQVIAPTCTEEGYTVFACVRCWYAYADDYSDALGHDYQEGCCSRCDATDPGYYVAHGDQVMIYYPNGDSYITATASGNRLQSGTENEAAVWLVQVDESGCYTFTVDGLYLTSGSTGNQLYLADAPSDYSLWELISLGDGDFYVRNLYASYYGIPQYLEYYGNFTTYGFNASMPEIYTFRFVVVEGGADDNIVSSGQCGDNLFYTLDVNGHLNITGTGNVWDYAFSGWWQINTITFGEGVTGIGHYAFEYCTGLTEVTIPESIVFMGGAMFRYCGSLTTVTLCNEPEELWTQTFQGCGNVTTLYLRNNFYASRGEALLEAISVFDTLQTVYVETTLTQIGEYWGGEFACVDAPESVTVGGVTYYCYQKGAHDYAVSEYVEATCTEDGYVSYVCNVCGQTYVEIIYAQGHAYDSNGTCGVCGETTNYVMECGLHLDDLILVDGTYYTSAGCIVVIAVDAPLDYYLGGYTLKLYVDYYGTIYFSLTYWDQLLAAMNEDGYVVLTEQTLVWFLDLITGNPAWGEDETFLTYYIGFTTLRDPEGMMGDVNDDGVVNYLDAMLIAQFYVGDIDANDLNLVAADVNGDGVVNYLDAMMVAQFYVGDIDSFPADN